LLSGTYSEHIYARSNTDSPSAALPPFRLLAPPMAGAVITDQATGATFAAETGSTLLDAIQKAGLPINFGCRTGLCGADAVALLEGEEHLSAAKGDELSTLKRLGLEGKVRLACMCRVSGPVVIDRDPKAASIASSVNTRIKAASADMAAEAHITRVVIIGN